jgi:hypothetical protein
MPKYIAKNAINTGAKTLAAGAVYDEQALGLKPDDTKRLLEIGAVYDADAKKEDVAQVPVLEPVAVNTAPAKGKA